MIRVWSDRQSAGVLDRHGARGSTFVYDQKIDTNRAVSMTMPVRLASWNQVLGIHPIFEMNLPEGALRERLRLDFAKAIGALDNLDLLAIVGRSQIGRLRYTSNDSSLDEEVPFQSVDEILAAKRGGDLFSYMMQKFAHYSGISGVQPKVMIQDISDAAILQNDTNRHLQSIKGATHIVKFWNAFEYEQLAANEFFCLRAAQKCGLEVPRYRLSDNGLALVIDRFDLRADGTYCGIEDFCVLNGYPTEYKYRGSYETALFKRMSEFLHDTNKAEELKKLFTLFLLNCAVRNGDAHLKNFALIYDHVNGSARMAPVYDVVTTTVYLPQDSLALQFDGTTHWPQKKKLLTLAVQRCKLSEAEAKLIFEKVADAVSEASAEMRLYAQQHQEFARISDLMQSQWEIGLQESLGFVPSTWLSIQSQP